MYPNPYCIQSPVLGFGHINANIYKSIKKTNNKKHFDPNTVNILISNCAVI